MSKNALEAEQEDVDLVETLSKQIQLSGMRLDYTEDVLLESTVSKDPMKQFAKWFSQEKERAGSTKLEVNALSLSTCNVSGRPSNRIVLLKDFDSRGFVFYTNYQSKKAQEVSTNPHASMLFYWGERQVRIEGKVVKVSSLESDEYFYSRPRGSRIGAWASQQSSEIESREALDRKVKEIEEKFKDVQVIPRPPFWGGFRLVPDYIEFWQGRSSRLHDRIAFQRKLGEITNDEDGETVVQVLSDWAHKRLCP